MDAVEFLDLDAVAQACERFGVARLRVFGSAAAGRFYPEASDLDVLVEFTADAPTGVGPYLGLKEALESITGRAVDLVELGAVRNPYFARRALAEAIDVYAA